MPPFCGGPGLSGELDLTEGSRSDWPHFARWHYRGAGLGPVRRVFLLWHGPEPVGLCIFGFGALSNAARNRAFGLPGKLTGALARRINRDFASVTRLVLDPRYRGAGLASLFLRRCCERVEWPWIELVSEMATVVPFAESAGFRRLGHTGGRRAPAHPRPDEGPWGRSAWTDAARRRYRSRTRHSRPAYYVYDNRRREESHAR